MNRYLLTKIATCPRGCGMESGNRGASYRCPHVQLPIVDADEYVREALVRYYSKPDVAAAWRAAGGATNRAAVAANNEVERLKAELDGWRQSAVEGKTTPDSLAVIEAGLSKKIAAAQARADKAAMPASLGWLYADPTLSVADAWDNGTLQARRRLLRDWWTVQFVSVGHARGVPIGARVRIAPREG